MAKSKQEWNNIQKKLEDKAREFLKESYGLELKVPVLVNGRLTASFGRFIYKGSNNPLKIEISKNSIEHQEWKLVIECLIHECIHYALYMKGLPHLDGEPYFEAELKKHGAHSTNTVVYKGKAVRYGCSGCGEVWHRRRKIRNISQYVSGCCYKSIQFHGETIV